MYVLTPKAEPPSPASLITSTRKWNPNTKGLKLQGKQGHLRSRGRMWTESSQQGTERNSSSTTELCSDNCLHQMQTLDFFSFCSCLCWSCSLSSSAQQHNSTGEQREGWLTAVEKWWITAMEMQASQEPLRIGTDRASQTKAWKCFSPQIPTRFLLRSQPT